MKIQKLLNIRITFLADHALTDNQILTYQKVTHCTLTFDLQHKGLIPVKDRKNMEENQQFISLLTLILSGTSLPRNLIIHKCWHPDIISLEPNLQTLMYPNMCMIDLSGKLFNLVIYIQINEVPLFWEFVLFITDNKSSLR